MRSKTLASDEMEEGRRILLLGGRGIMKHEVDWFKCIIASFSSHWTVSASLTTSSCAKPDLGWEMSRSENIAGNMVLKSFYISDFSDDTNKKWIKE